MRTMGATLAALIEKEFTRGEKEDKPGFAAKAKQRRGGPARQGEVESRGQVL